MSSAAKQIKGAVRINSVEATTISSVRLANCVRHLRQRMFLRSAGNPNGLSHCGSGASQQVLSKSSAATSGKRSRTSGTGEGVVELRVVEFIVKGDWANLSRVQI